MLRVFRQAREDAGTASAEGAGEAVNIQSVRGREEGDRRRRQKTARAEENSFVVHTPTRNIEAPPHGWFPRPDFCTRQLCTQPDQVPLQKTQGPNVLRL